MKHSRILALVLSFCMILSVSAFAATDMPDTSKGGKATSRPPDNSTKAVDILGTRAAVYVEYGEDGYTVSQNITDDYTVDSGDIAAPASGEPYEIGGISIYCGAEGWDEKTEVGNSGIIINQRTDETTPVLMGGDEKLYEAPDGKKYNSVIAMDVDENEELAVGATETAPGVGIAFNGSAMELKNVYVSSDAKSRPAIHIPSPSRDKNATQLSDLICVDSTVMSYGNRGMLLMGGDVWFLNSQATTYTHGALSYDNTSTTMYVVNSLSENIGTGGYSVYDAAGCTMYIYGSRVLAGGNAIIVCRNAVLTMDDLDKADKAATEPYDGAADLMKAAATADGRSELISYAPAIKMHADMSGPDSQAAAYLNNTYVSTMEEDIAFSDGTVYADWETESTGIRGLISDYQSGDCVVMASHNGKVVFDGCELKSRSGVLVHSLFTYDSMASGIYPEDGVEYAGDEVVIKNMTAEGDILHEDYMRKMDLSLESAELTGKVVGTTLAGWNNYWTEVVDNMPESELSEASGEMDARETTLQNCVYNDTYETMWGVRMTMDADSVWNVTGDSNLYSFTMEDGAVINGAAEIYVDCEMSNAKEGYDITTGTKIDAFEPGVEYSGVVILTGETGVTLTVGAEELASLGIETSYENGVYQVSLGDLLTALGADMSYDEDTGTVTVVDETGAIGGLIAGSAG